MVRSELVEKEREGCWKVWMPIGEYNHSFRVEVSYAGVYIDNTLFPWKELDIARKQIRRQAPQG